MAVYSRNRPPAIENRNRATASGFDRVGGQVGFAQFDKRPPVRVPDNDLPLRQTDGSPRMLPGILVKKRFSDDPHRISC
jgi:hypothetical protein